MQKTTTGTRSYEIDMIHGPLMPKLVTFFVPLMFSGVLQLLFNAVDLIVVGKWAGSDCLASVGATTALIHLFCNLLIGISLGTNVIAARFLARDDRKGIQETVETSITVALIAGIILLFIGLFFSKICLIWMGTPDNVLPGSILYMRIYFCGMPFFMLYNYGAAILRAAGDTRRPLYYLIFAGILNAALNMLLVILFHLDVAGVGIATVFSQMISCLLIIRCLITTKENYHLSFRNLHINRPILKSILAIGLPAGLQSTVINFSNVLLQSSVNSFGAVAVAGYTAANNLFGFLYTSVNSVTQACMSFTSQNYAVHRIDRVKRVILDCMLLECIVAALLGGSFYVFGPNILSIYTNAPDVIACGMEVLTYTTLTYFMCGLMDCLPGALRGMGHSAIPMILSIIGTVGMRLFWIFILFPMHRSLRFLFISYPASWFATILMQSICLLIVFRRCEPVIPGENGSAPPV